MDGANEAAPEEAFRGGYGTAPGYIGVDIEFVVVAASEVTVAACEVLLLYKPLLSCGGAGGG